jgi:thiamine pyrophosphate-dependent acetolactate synthase large subunit-like protein
LRVEGVKHVFGIVGSTFLEVLDRLDDDSSVEYINIRHEQAAAFMADGLARVIDRPGVCLVTSGPGATNLMTGVAAAYVAHSPVVVLVGGHRARSLPEGRLSGIRPARGADQQDRAVGDAVKTALGAGAPAIIEIPIDPDEFPTPAAAVRRPDQTGRRGARRADVVAGRGPRRARPAYESRSYS